MIKQYDASFLVKELGEFLKKLRAYEPHNLQRDNELAKKAWTDSQIIEGILGEYHKLDEKDKKEYKTFTDYSLKFKEIKDNLLPFIPEKIKKESPSIEELMIKYFGIDTPVLPQLIIDKLKNLRKEQSLEFCVLKIEEDEACNIYGKQNPEEALECYDKKDTSKFPTRYIVKFKRDIQKGKEEFIPMIIDPDNLRKKPEIKLELPSKPKEKLEEKVINAKETTTPELEDIYLKKLEGETAQFIALWREGGKFQDPRRCNTAREMLEDMEATKKHPRPGVRYYEKKSGGKYKRIESLTAKSYLEEIAKKEPQEIKPLQKDNTAKK